MRRLQSCFPAKYCSGRRGLGIIGMREMFSGRHSATTSGTSETSLGAQSEGERPLPSEALTRSRGTLPVRWQLYISRAGQ